MITVSNIEFDYGRNGFQLMIDELTFSDGEKVAIIGASGSGKSTLLQLLSGILVPTSGTITIDNHPINQLSDAERRAFRLKNIGAVFQNFELIEYLNGYNNVLNTFRLNPILKLNTKDINHADFLIEKMGLSDKKSRYPSQLSQGEQQRFAICRALVTNPKYIFADEPTGNLDPANKDVILNLLFESVAISKSTLLTVTHDRNLLERFDRVIDFSKFE